MLGYWPAFRHGCVLRYWPAFRHGRVLGCADVGLADRGRRAFAGPVIAEPRETLIRPVIAERQQTVVFVQVIRVDQASSPLGFHLGHRRRKRRLLIPVIPGAGRRHACGHLRACFRRGPRQGAQLGLSVRQRLMRQVPGVETAPGLGLRSALSRVPELALSDVLGLGLTGVPGLGVTRLAGLAMTGVLGLTGVPGLGVTRLAGLAMTGVLGLTGVPGLGLTRLLGLALTGVLGLAVLGLRLWPRRPCAERAATQRCARTLALPSRPVLSHDPAYPPNDSLSAFT